MFTPTNNPTIQALWENYRDQVVAKDAGPEQRLEMERTFYAACALLLDMMRRTNEAHTDQAYEAIIMSMLEELDTFWAKLRREGSMEQADEEISNATHH
jgi:hypothetical protein